MSAIAPTQSATPPASVAPATGAAAPAARPSRPTRGTDWELDFRPGPLRLYVDPTDAKAYWYFTYRVVNRTGEDRMWAPRFEFFSDRGAIITSGATIPTAVTKSIMSMLGNPLLENQNQILGELRVGEEHAKDGVVIWPADDQAITEFTVFVSGVSGKVRKVPDPRTKEPRVERWTVRFNYTVPGDPATRGSTAVAPASTDPDLADGAERRTDLGVWIWR